MMPNLETESKNKSKTWVSFGPVWPSCLNLLFGHWQFRAQIFLGQQFYHYAPREISAVFPEINHRLKPTNQVVGDFQESYSESKLCDFYLYHTSRNFRANVEGAASVIFVHKVNCLEEDSLALSLTC